MSATAACADLAPQGILRASINLGNPLLARRDGSSGEVFGVSVDLARALAERLGELPARLAQRSGFRLVGAEDDGDFRVRVFEAA